jgi:hypothetical protein
MAANDQYTGKRSGFFSWQAMTIFKYDDHINVRPQSDFPQGASCHTSSAFHNQMRAKQLSSGLFLSPSPISQNPVQANVSLAFLETASGVGQSSAFVTCSVLVFDAHDYDNDCPSQYDSSSLVRL